MKDNSQQRRHAKHRAIHEEQPEGVLTMRMPAWKENAGSDDNERFEQETDSVLTIRQQSDLARSLRYNNDQQSTQLSRYERGSDPAQAWHRFIGDLKTGRENTRQKRRKDRRRRGKKKRQQTTDSTGNVTKKEVWSCHSITKDHLTSWNCFPS